MPYEGMHPINRLVDHNLIIPAFIKVYIQETLLEDRSSNVGVTYVRIVCKHLMHLLRMYFY